MEIMKIYDRNRRDFTFDATCEHCAYEDKECSGYDDHYFHKQAMPNRKCDGCGESSNSKEIEGRPKKTVTPKYPAHKVV